MRIEVIGCRGQLGRELMEVLEGSSHEASGHDVDGVDVADPASVAAVLEAARPEAVINCAAWTAVDTAESEPEAAWQVNATGPRVLAEACRDRGIWLCHLSTDYVFDGTATEPIPEDATPHPRSAYGRGKLAGEEAVREVLPGRHQVVRTSWLYGQRGPNFVLTILRAAGEGRPLRVVDDQWGSPTWTGHLAPALIRLLELAAAGTYHLTGSGSTSWHGFAEAILAAAGIRAALEPIPTSARPAPAPRPAYSVLDNRAWRELGEAPLPAWEGGLRTYLRRLSESHATQSDP